MARSRGALQSAEIAAAARALAAAEGDPAVRNPDSLATRFLGPRYRLLTSAPFAPLARRIAARRGPGLYWFATARSKHIDAVLHAELQAGLRQLVILGAGFDTRVYRLASDLSRTQTFELDFPAVVHVKARRARRLRSKAAPVIRLGIDLEHEAIDEVLPRHGFVNRDRTLVIAEAVLMFLDDAAVRRVWRSVARLGASLVFDGFDVRKAESPAMARVLIEAQRIGAPVRFMCAFADVPSRLAEEGLRLRSLLSGTEAADRYLVASTGRRCEPVAPFLWLAHASA